jgi:hypothetical protein
MKMIFFSASHSEVQQLGKALVDAGISCEVRKELMVEGVPVELPETELWVQNDNDSNRAFLFCVERNAGFARREINGFCFEAWSEGLAA